VVNAGTQPAVYKHEVAHSGLDYGRDFPLNAQTVGAFVSCVGTCNEVRNGCGVRVSS
jgi:hypothetical protein